MSTSGNIPPARPSETQPTPMTSTATTTTQSQQQQQQQQLPTSPLTTTYSNPFLHNIALATTPIAALGLALPPRRLDLRAAVLGGTLLWGVFQLKYDYTGKSSLHGLQTRLATMTGDQLPTERAAETQRLLREDKARRETVRRIMRERGVGEAEARRVWGLEQQQQQQQQRTRGGGDGESERGALESIWLGDAEPDWKAKRAEREKEALSEGGDGVWGLISEQISEVFTRGEKKAREEKEKVDGTGRGDEEKKGS